MRLLGRLHLRLLFHSCCRVRNIATPNFLPPRSLVSTLFFTTDNYFSVFLIATTKPIDATLECVFSACAQNGCAKLSRWVYIPCIHEKRIKLRVKMSKAVLVMYGKCGAMDIAEIEGLVIFFDILNQKFIVGNTVKLQGEGKTLSANEVAAYISPTWLEVNEFVNPGDFDRSVQKVLAEMTNRGVDKSIECTGNVNAIMGMYVSCGFSDGAIKVFDERLPRDVLSWSAVMSARVKAGRHEGEFELFREMKTEGRFGTRLTSIMYHNQTLNSSFRIATRSLVKGNWQQLGFDPGGVCAMVLVYAAAAYEFVFIKRISGHIAVDILGDGQRHDVLGLHEFDSDRMRMSVMVGCVDKTGTTILSACNQDGLVDHGWEYFHMMEEVVTPTFEHLIYMIKILSTAGLLVESMDFIGRRSCEPDAYVWATVPQACRLHSDYEIRKKAKIELLSTSQPEANLPFISADSREIPWSFQSGYAIPVGGLAHYVTAPSSLADMAANPFHALFYMVFLLSVLALLSNTWIEVFGSFARDVAKQLKEPQLVVSGYSESTLQKELNHYICTASTVPAITTTTTMTSTTKASTISAFSGFAFTSTCALAVTTPTSFTCIYMIDAENKVVFHVLLLKTDGFHIGKMESNGLLVIGRARKYAIVKELDEPVILKDGTIVLQIETKLQNGVESVDKVLPVDKEGISELKPADASWILCDEPTLVLDLDSNKLEAFTKAYTAWE